MTPTDARREAERIAEEIVKPLERLWGPCERKIGSESDCGGCRPCVSFTLTHAIKRSVISDLITTDENARKEQRESDAKVAEDWCVHNDEGLQGFVCDFHKIAAAIRKGGTG